jgi:hypothetical protein
MDGRTAQAIAREPETTEAERRASGAFVTLSPYRDGNIFCAKFSSDAAWERHPNGDELVQIVDGVTTLHDTVDVEDPRTLTATQRAASQTE